MVPSVISLLSEHMCCVAVFVCVVGTQTLCFEVTVMSRDSFGVSGLVGPERILLTPGWVPGPACPGG